MTKNKKSGFFLGAILGAIAGILFAPKSGKQTRADIGRESKKAANQAKRSATKSANTAKRKAEKVSKALKS